MRLKFPALLCSSLLLAGCQIFSSGTPTNGPTSRLQGTLEQNAQQQWQLVSCQDQSTQTLIFPPGQTQALEHCLADDAQSCFADLEVQHGPQQDAEVVHIHRIQHEGHGCNDEEFPHLQLRAFGNEPFWSVRLNHQGLILQQPGQPALALPLIHEQLGDGLQLISSQADHQSLRLWISPQPCTDSMSGAWHALSARLEWQGQHLTGCAYPGAQHITSP